MPALGRGSAAVAGTPVHGFPLFGARGAYEVPLVTLVHKGWEGVRGSAAVASWPYTGSHSSVLVGLMRSPWSRWCTKEMLAFAELVLGRRENPCPPEDSVAASQAADAAQLSLLTGVPVKVDP
jgi:predicted dehydrogenase